MLIWLSSNLKDLYRLTVSCLKNNNYNPKIDGNLFVRFLKVLGSVLGHPGLFPILQRGGGGGFDFSKVFLP